MSVNDYMTRNYRKLEIWLNAKWYAIRAKELGSFGSGWLVSINDVKPIGDWHILVIKNGNFCNGVYFKTLRQVQRWAEKGFKDCDIPKIPLEDGTFKVQHLS